MEPVNGGSIADLWDVAESLGISIIESREWDVTRLDTLVDAAEGRQSGRWRQRVIATHHLEEAASLADLVTMALAPPIGLPESPDEPVITRMPGYDDPALRATR